MTPLLAASERDTVPLQRIGVPVVPPWTLPRARLDRLLDLGAERTLTVVSAPTGSGKTMGVASWVAGPTSPDRVLWVNLARGGAQPDRIWRLLRRTLQHVGEQHLPPFEAGPDLSPDRIHMLVELGEALRERAPWTVVLDGYPTGPSSRLGAELEVVLDHARGHVRLVVLSDGAPALEQHRFEALGDLVRVSAVDLMMDDAEIAAMLGIGPGAGDDQTVGVVRSRTVGWPCGVRRAAVALAETTHVEGALEETARAVEEYLGNEVLARLAAPVRRLLVWASPAEVVAPELVEAALGRDGVAAIDRTIADTGLVTWLPDGALECHALLRAAARARLPREQPGDSPAVHHTIARWFAEHGQADAALALYLATRDRAAAASVLVESHAVPRLVAGIADNTVRGAAELPAVHAAEPLLQAAVALARHDLATAEAALAAGTPRSGSPADLLAAAFLELGIARLSGRPLPDPDCLSRTRRLLAEATVVALDSLEDLSAGLDAFEGAAHLASGDHERAAVVLARGADRGSLDCAGQLAVVEARRGDLSEAERHARLVLAAGTGGSVGALHARTALAWVCVDRGELAEAQAHLDETSGGQRTAEPWLRVVHQALQARVLIGAGQPDEAMRRSVALEVDRESPAGWLVDLVSSVVAEAWLASGEPHEALAVVTLGLPPGSLERAVMTATACRHIGDVRGAGAALTSVGHDLHRSPRATQIQGWVLDARLALDRGQADRATVLVERALRSASSEDLRRPLAADAVWLRWFLDRDGSALRDFRPFVSSLLAQDTGAPRSTVPVRRLDEAVLEPLTERETQVLQLLAQMCSTDEIAAELFVSANTVKTHLKGIFRKYAVNRRVDAVRRGRELGLC